MHVFAINRDGGLIPASEAKSGIVYHCPICNCEMYRTSRKGTDYYACMPGYVHSHPVCQKVDRNKTARITGLTHRDVFHA